MSPPVPLLPLAIAVVSPFLGSLFAAADTAITTLSSARLGALLEQAEGRQREALERIADDEVKLRSRYVLGRVAASAVTACAFTEVFAAVSPRWAVHLAVLATVALTGTLFEIMTTLGRKHADWVAPAAARWLRPLELVIMPLAVPLGWVGAWLTEREAPRSMADVKVAEAEVEILVDEVEKSGIFGREPAEMIRNVLEFADMTCREVMIPRDKIEAIDVSQPIDRIIAFVGESGHSRYPAYRDQMDNIVGLLYAKDLFKAIAPRGDGSNPPPPMLEDLVRTPANFVAESQSLSSLLREMRSRRQHLAIVVDELGALSGIVTLEDILEEIVGDIRDEHDDAPPVPIQDLGGGRLVADADVSVSDLSAYLGEELPRSDDGESLAGMLTELMGKAPEAGSEISMRGMQFIVRDAGKVEIIRPAAHATATS